MEHAGATFLNEDGVLFRTTPTQSDYFRRDILVLHETTHQWFGDLVTMRWFDDLWLKEGFAQYMAYKAQAALKPETLPWKHFYEDIKPLAYGIDETQGTTPIFQQIPNLKDAKSAYGAIVYQKAPAILKQLDFRLGDEVFRNGLRLYLSQHAYANAQWADLISAFTQAGGKNVQPWADAWVLRRGMPQVEVEWSCGRATGPSAVITRMVLTQRDVLHDNFTWPMSNEVLLEPGPRSHVAPLSLRVDWHGLSTSVRAAIGKPCPAFVAANSGDFAYGRFLLDRSSEGSVRSVLTTSTAAPVDPLLHSMLWGALWDNVRVAKSPPSDFVESVLRTLPTESDESLNRIQGGRLATSLHFYLPDHRRKSITPAAEEVIADLMLHAPSLGVRIVNFRIFTAIAETPPAVAKIKHLLDGSLSIDGLTLRSLDRWNLVAHLVAIKDPGAPTLLAVEQARDKSGEALKYAYAANAGTPDAATKQRYWNDYLHNATLQEDWITQSLGSLNAWNQGSLTLPYLSRALDQLPDIKLHRRIFFLGAWLNSFIGGQRTTEAQVIVHQWLLRRDIDPDLRLKALEVSDALDRTIMIRKRFPQ